MKALFIGGTGTISSAISALAVEQGVELTLLNRGSRGDLIPKGAEVINCDISDEADAAKKLEGRSFDVVADFIAFRTDQVERDIRLFSGKTSQYIFISSASAYQKPLSNPIINEATPLANPYWQYSRDKIACEDRLMAEYRENGFPVTIIRPSHTYSDRSVPVAVHGKGGSWQVLERMRRGKPVLVHGDGLSLWALLHNTDFARAFVGIMDNPHAIGEAFQITNDESITWNAVYAAIGRALGVEPNLCHISSHALERENPDLKGSLIGDKANSVLFDNSKIKGVVPGFLPRVRFDQGARQAVEYILARPELQVADPDFDNWCDEMVIKFEG
ncbi:MAG: SDR family oxidoreductase [Oscillospiraceae bacterium]